MQFMTRFIGAFILGIAGFACAAAPAPALAQTPYPSKPVRLIIPFPPGGSTDVLARLLGEKLSSRWGQAVVVDNKPGANTLIGAQAAATAPADGYTLFMPIDFTLTMNQSLYSKLPYDPKKDFAPITLLTVQPILISVNPKLPVKSCAGASGEHEDTHRRLDRFGQERSQQKLKLIGASERSFMWYEHMARWMDSMTPAQFVYSYMKRTGRVSDARLRTDYPELAEFFRHSNIELSEPAEP